MEEIIDALSARIAEEVCCRLDQRLATLEESRKPHFLTRREAANFLKISLPTLHKMINEGRLHPLAIGGRRLFSQADLMAAMEAGTVRKYQRFN